MNLRNEMETYWLKNKIILLGPYVGSIEDEILSFKPFINWFKKNIKSSNIIVSTHYNRQFLYEDAVIPIFKQYTKDEINQFRHKHKKIKAKDFLIIDKYIKNQILEVSDYNKKDIVSYNLGYSSIPNLSWYQKLFLSSENNSEKEGVTFIPHYSRPDKENRKIYDFLKNNCASLKVSGDKKTNLKEFNEIFEKENYNDIVYETIIYDILKSKVVVTPCSFWTLICKLYGVPVFSWGKNISYYKSIFNDNCKVIPFKMDDDINKILKPIEKYLKENLVC